MTVNRTTNQEGPALMTIHFKSLEAAATTKPPINSTTDSQTSTGPVPASTASVSTERAEIINMKNKKVSEILTQVLEITKAREMKATVEETRQIQELKEQRERSERESEKRADAMEKRKREDAIMAQARNAVDAARQG
jgi:large subunit ribosomal protein MRP49